MASHGGVEECMSCPTPQQEREVEEKEEERIPSKPSIEQVWVIPGLLFWGYMVFMFMALLVVILRFHKHHHGFPWQLVLSIVELLCLGGMMGRLGFYRWFRDPRFFDVTVQRGDRVMRLPMNELRQGEEETMLSS